MKNVSNGFKQSIVQLGRQQTVEITYDDTTLNGEDINSINFSYDGGLLKSIMTGFVIDSNVSIPVETEINIKYGLLVDGSYEYIDYGTYIVYKSEKKEDTKSYEITAYDKMLNAMKEYTGMGLQFPITVQQYVISLANSMGIPYTPTEFTNYNNALENDPYASKDEVTGEESGIGYTYRDILDDIAEVTATHPIIKNGELVLSWINQTDAVINEDYLKDVNVKFGKIYGPINSVVLSRSVSDNIYLKDEESIEENGLCEFKISDNQIMNNNNRDAYISGIFNKLRSVSYALNDFSSIGIMFLEPLDKYTITVENVAYSCIMFNDEQNITQGLEENIYTNEPEQGVTDYMMADKTDQRLNQTTFIIDKANQKAELAITNSNQAISQVTTLTAEVGRIESEISEIAGVTKTATGNGEVELEGINTSEPINIKIHPQEIDIKALYPREDLFPSAGLFPHSRELYFINTTDGIVQKYDLPGDLLWLNNLVYDEFYLVYGDRSKGILQECYIIRKVGVDEQGNKYELETPVKEVLATYPHIPLTEGNYRVVLKSNMTAYLYIELMANNLYTSQFATRQELSSAITQAIDEVSIDVDAKLENYSTTTELEGKINTSATEILATVRQTYKTIDSANQDKIELQSAINLKADSATLGSYYTKNQSDDKFSTKAELTTGIGTLQDGKIDKVTNKTNADSIISYINASADVINLNAGRLLINSGNFTLTSNGTATLTSATFNGGIINMYNSSHNLELQITGNGLYVYSNGVYAGSFNGGSYAGDTSQKGLAMDLSENSKYLSFTYQKENEDYFIFRYQKANSIGRTNEGMYFSKDIFIDDHAFFTNYDQTTYIANSTHRNGNELYDGIKFADLKHYNEFFDASSDFITMRVTDSIEFYGGSFTFNGYSVLTSESDGRLKHNIKDTQASALSQISQIEHRQFNWNKDNSKVDIGYIAQEVEKINPQLVIKTPQYDENKNIIDYTYSMNILNLVALCTKAIQELNDKVEGKSLLTEIKDKIKNGMENLNEVDYGTDIKYTRIEKIIPEKIEEYKKDGKIIKEKVKDEIKKIYSKGKLIEERNK